MLLVYVIIKFLMYIYNVILKFFLTQEIDLIDRYGKDSWVIVTGCSSGQGKRFVIEFAKRGFNILLVGREAITKVAQRIESKYSVKTKTFVTDFTEAYKVDYFKELEEFIDRLPGELSILVNNVGHRVAWKPYHEMPEKLIHDTITVGTFVQARLTQIALKRFTSRTKKSAIINITAQCIIPSSIASNDGYITVPYLSAYEAANAFGFFHSNSIEKEYGDRIDILNVTPGAVITENTQFLRGTPFSIECKEFVKNVFKLLGNYTGPTCAYWGHEIGGLFANISSIYKEYILRKVGKVISSDFMKKNTN